nr:MAG TPA: hypothetical protein [Caudoviricetes sp.]
MQDCQTTPTIRIENSGKNAIDNSNNLNPSI